MKNDIVTELMIAIPCSLIPSLFISIIILKLLSIDTQPLYGQIIICIWIISSIVVFLLIHNDNIKRDGE